MFCDAYQVLLLFSLFVGCMVERLITMTSHTGVNDANIRPLMRAAGSLAGLARMTEEELAEAMEGRVAARKLKSFLSQDCRALFHQL